MLEDLMPGAALLRPSLPRLVPQLLQTTPPVMASHLRAGRHKPLSSQREGECGDRHKRDAAKGRRQCDLAVRGARCC